MTAGLVSHSDAVFHPDVVAGIVKAEEYVESSLATLGWSVKLPPNFYLYWVHSALSWVKKNLFLG